ncbi:hypothetical protein NUH88_05600 [Nisaea acidiphila]|uniref:DUF4760 domain-containing protein n=1 Tax=Nisaea acidiphila TaxID=1862145 RepID=A0A9J7AY24_9PROT|nr:hypothetical protein [Nisaea acidiphila]UUX51164.1 hypothetical protein NUH88_05600 [Nisaea acidiphila]
MNKETITQALFLTLTAVALWVALMVFTPGVYDASSIFIEKWGGFFGAMLGVGGVYAVALMQIKAAQERENERRTREIRDAKLNFYSAVRADMAQWRATIITTDDEFINKRPIEVFVRSKYYRIAKYSDSSLDIRYAEIIHYFDPKYIPRILGLFLFVKNMREFIDFPVKEGDGDLIPLQEMLLFRKRVATAYDEARGIIRDLNKELQLKDKLPSTLPEPPIED